MIRTIFLLQFTLAVTLFMSSNTHAAERPLALVYNGPGSCKGCPEDTAKALKLVGFRTKWINSNEINSENLSEASLYVQPGGTDNVEDTMKHISKNAIRSLQQFVNNGGAYLGICAGAYLAGVEIRDRKVIPGFALVDVGFEIENTSDDARVLDVNWDGREFRKVYYQAGPYFTESSRFESINVATYTKSNHSAAMIYKVGKGRVGVLGPHFEAFKDWYTDDDLEAPQALNHDLFGEFIERLFEAN